MQTMLTVIATWLSVNFGLPAVYEQPRVEFVSAAKMVEVRYSRLAASRLERLPVEAERSASAEAGRNILAFYDDRSRTIYLPQGWTPASVGHVSLLVHELVHHLQNAAGLQYDCPQARERPAYLAQARWLELFAKSFADEFEIDAMTMLLRTSCLR